MVIFYTSFVYNACVTGGTVLAVPWTLLILVMALNKIQE
jgi:hypothetical protein